MKPCTMMMMWILLAFKRLKKFLKMWVFSLIYETNTVFAK